MEMEDEEVEKGDLAGAPASPLRPPPSPLRQIDTTPVSHNPPNHPRNFTYYTFPPQIPASHYLCHCEGKIEKAPG